MSDCDYDDIDDAPTFMGWARYRFGRIGSWLVGLVRRKPAPPPAKPSTLNLSSFDAMLKEHYRPQDMSARAVREHPFLAGTKMKAGPRRWVMPAIATRVDPEGDE